MAGPTCRVLVLCNVVCGLGTWYGDLMFIVLQSHPTNQFKISDKGTIIPAIVFVKANTGDYGSTGMIPPPPYIPVWQKALWYTGVRHTVDQ